jgi:eukaryotic translation initiation factor 2C
MESNEEPEALTPPPDALPPPPPEIPPNVVPVQLTTDTFLEETKKISKIKRSPITRRGVGSRGQKIQLVTNHFKVSISNTGGHFFHYSVCFFAHVIFLSRLLFFSSL